MDGWSSQSSSVIPECSVSASLWRVRKAVLSYAVMSTAQEVDSESALPMWSSPFE